MRCTTPSKTLPTRNTFTGQYGYVADEATDLGSAGFGVMFYQSRFYDPRYCIEIESQLAGETIRVGIRKEIRQTVLVSASPLGYNQIDKSIKERKHG